MEGFELQKNLSAEELELQKKQKQERQDKFAELLDVIDYLSSNENSYIKSDFIEYLDDENLPLEDYFLANVFVSRISKGELPEASNYDFYDTDDGKIEKYIMNLADAQEIAA